MRFPVNICHRKQQPARQSNALLFSRLLIAFLILTIILVLCPESESSVYYDIPGEFAQKYLCLAVYDKDLEKCEWNNSNEI